MTGPVALIGGGEHTSGCEPIERRLLELTGATRPQVAVVPTAAARRQLAKTAALARNYWSRLGTRVEIAVPERDLYHAEAAVAHADVIVLPGGHPNKLVASLGASPLTGVLIDRWLGGAAISASSAGAMCLFEWRIKLYPANPLQTVPGLGLLDGYVAAPHFERFVAHRWAHLTTSSLGGLGVIGLDESTALVGRSGQFEIIGKGGVALVGGGGTLTCRAGERVSIDLMASSRLRLKASRVLDREIPLSSSPRHLEGVLSLDEAPSRKRRHDTQTPETHYQEREWASTTEYTAGMSSSG